MKPLIYLFVIVLTMSIATAVESDYELILKENGQALVLITLEGEGIVTIPVYDDVESVNVKGGLYLMEDNKVDVSIGSAGGATVGFVTSFLTEKNGDLWQLQLDVLDQTRKVILHAPEEIIVVASSPNALIEKGEVVNLYWQDNPDFIRLEYTFEEIAFTDESDDKPKLWSILITIIAIITLGIGISFLAYSTMKKKGPKRDQKQDIMQTLLKNEHKIVEILINHGNGMKRNELERKSEISKSSLASSLYNLERKKIIEIDKSQTVHFVTLRKWFYEL